MRITTELKVRSWVIGASVLTFFIAGLLGSISMSCGGMSVPQSIPLPSLIFGIAKATLGSSIFVLTIFGLVRVFAGESASQPSSPDSWKASDFAREAASRLSKNPEVLAQDNVVLETVA